MTGPERLAAADTIVAGIDFSPQITRWLLRGAAADGQALLAEWQDQADDALLGAPGGGSGGNPRLSAYIERWVVAAMQDWRGPFDHRFGNIRQSTVAP